MRAAKYENLTHNHSMPVPENSPDGTPVQVVMLAQDTAATVDRQHAFKGWLCEVAQGLSDTNPERTRETNGPHQSPMAYLLATHIIYELPKGARARPSVQTWFA